MLQQYKCPCCDGAINFDSGTQKMKCPYCDAEFEMETLQSYDAELNNDQPENMTWETSAGSEWDSAETGNLCTYLCNSCGGEIVGEATTAAMSCPYCDNPVVMMNQLAGMLKPDLVIPFKYDKEAAKAALKAHYAGKRLLPKVFKDENHVDEIKGMYVPCWLFDADADGAIRYKATKVRRYSDARFDYTETSYYSVRRRGTMGFDAIPVDGCEKMPDELMESIEPFHVEEAVPFQTAYLSGYLADKYDVTAEQSIERANDRIRSSVRNTLRSTVTGYDTVTAEGEGITLMNGRSRYALYPVWLLNTSWNGQKYTFIMNGQTGKLAGDLPMDKSLFTKYLFGLTGICTAASFVVLTILYFIGLF